MVCSKAFLSNLALLKTMGYSKGFFSKLGHFEISHSRVCMCSLGPPERFANKPWCVVRPFCQTWLFLKCRKTMGYSNSKLGHFEISHSRVFMCSLGPPECFANKLWSVVRPFCQTWLFLKCRKTMGYSKGFFSKLGHFEISHSRVCMCSLGPPERFANKPWSVVRPTNHGV